MLFVAAVSAVDKTIAVVDPRNTFTIATLNLPTAASYSQHSSIITVLDQFTAQLTKRPRYVFADKCVIRVLGLLLRSVLDCTQELYILL